jgi:hypothetical protein
MVGMWDHVTQKRCNLIQNRRCNAAKKHTTTPQKRMMLPVFSAPLRTGGFRAAINLVRHVASSSSSSSSSSSTNAVMAAAATAPAAAVSHESAAPSSSSSPSSATATMSFPELAATLRGTGHSGSRRSRQLRDQGRIPGVLYGLDDDRNVLKRMVSVDLKTIAAELRERKSSMENTIYRLRLDDGTTHLVTPRQLQVHPRELAPLSRGFPPLFCFSCQRSLLFQCWTFPSPSIF